MHLGIKLGVKGSSMDMWKTGCTAWSASGSLKVKDWGPTLVMIL